LIDHISGGGHVLLSGMGVMHGSGRPLHNAFGISDVVGPKAAELLTTEVDGQPAKFEHHLFRCRPKTAKVLLSASDKSGKCYPLLTRNDFGAGIAYYFATPLLSSHGKNVIPKAVLNEVFEIAIPPGIRQVTTDAPETVEVVLRQQGHSRVLHLINMARGDREVFKSGRRSYVNIRDLPSVPPCQVSIASHKKPMRVSLQPQNKQVPDWQYNAGRVQATLPKFKIHQMLVLEYD
jgi:hypothetical protein